MGRWTVDSDTKYLEQSASGARHAPQPLSSALDRVLAGLGAPPADVLTRVGECWGELVGAEAAVFAEPVAVEAGTLVMTVREAAWVAQMRWLEAEILRRAQALLGPGVVTRVEVRQRRR